MTALELTTSSKNFDIGTDQVNNRFEPDCRMGNERITEGIVRDHFRQDPYYNKITWEEQTPKDPRINKLLKTASKKGSGAGKPDFIISFKDEPNLLMIVECKSDTRKHESATRDKYDEYAVDGVLLYSSYLSKSFDVISIAYSGESTKNNKISHFLQLRDSIEAKKFVGNTLLTLENYIEKYKTDDLKIHQDFNEIMKYSKKLNLWLHQLKIKESLRSLLIAGILLALKNDVFKNGYELYKNPKTLTRDLVNTISTELKEGKIQESKINDLVGEYAFIKRQDAFTKNVNELKNIIRDIDENLNNFIKTHMYNDVLGEFYIEFLRYANSDKGLGIVLTPPHITKLFADIAKVNKDSVVFDNCCGTGGFLISAMEKMMVDAKGNKTKENSIKHQQLLGIEYQNDIFALACSNMFIHGDGSSRIYKGDCFSTELIDEIKKEFKEEHGKDFKPNVGFLNPPYKTNAKTDKEEFEFILNNLEMLEPNGTCIAIIPISCVTATSGSLLELKQKLMANHTLEAVFSMPNELFYNSDVCTICVVLVFTAHKPHPDNRETFLAYWKDDGFTTTKNFGRSDQNNKWQEKRRTWLYEFESKKTTPHCFTKLLKADDEWCIEAYMETDYSILKEDDFTKVVKDYVLFNIKNSD